MKSFYYVFTATLLLGTSTLNAGKLEWADSEHIETKIARLYQQEENVAEDTEKQFITQQIEKLSDLLGLKNYPVGDMQAAYEADTIGAYRKARNDRYAVFHPEKAAKNPKKLFNREKEEKAIKEEKKNVALEPIKKEEEEIKKEAKAKVLSDIERKEIESLVVPQLTLEDFRDWLSVGDNPFDEPETAWGEEDKRFNELVKHRGLWEVGDKSLAMFGLKIQGVNLADYNDHFTPTHPAPQRAPTEDDGTNNPFLQLTKDDPETLGRHYAMCYYLNHKTDPLIKIEAPIFFISKGAIEVNEGKNGNNQFVRNTLANFIHQPPIGEAYQFYKQSYRFQGASNEEVAKYILQSRGYHLGYTWENFTPADTEWIVKQFQAY